MKDYAPWVPYSTQRAYFVSARAAELHLLSRTSARRSSTLSPSARHRRDGRTTGTKRREGRRPFRPRNQADLRPSIGRSEPGNSRAWCSVTSIRRFLWAIVLFLAVTIVTYVIFFIIPPTRRAACGQACTPQDVARVRHFLGSTQPVYVQYGHFLWTPRRRTSPSATRSRTARASTTDRRRRRP